MSEIFTLKYKNVNIGTIDFSKKDARISRKCDLRFVPTRLKHFRNGSNTDLYPEFLEYVESRIVPRENQGITLIMKSLNLSKYSVKELLKINKAMDLNDCFWVTDNSLEDYYSEHIRENPKKYIKSICE